MRQLTDYEISELQERGCQAENWLSVFVADDFVPDRVSNVRFFGTVEIGSLTGHIEMEEGFVRSSGLSNVTLHNVTVGDGCLIENVSGYISDYNIGDRCCICNVGIISATGSLNFGIGNIVSVLNEGGDGNVVIFDRLTAQLAWLMIHDANVRRLVMREVNEAGSGRRGEIGNDVRILMSGEISNVCIGDSCEVHGASRLSMSTIQSSDDAPSYIGTDVIMENSVVACGASVVDGAKIDNCFIGETVHIGRGFSAESSLFFANSYMDNGEACASFCGPFSTSHHKSSLLIGGMFSFYNAGSATNQSNHAYKMGPVHWGVLDRGSKTASGCHIIWPATIGAFSMVMGKVSEHPDVRSLPFSYVIGNGTKTYIVPGINLSTVGTWRDVGKWPKRDKRPASAMRDMVNCAFPNPYVMQYVAEGKDLLRRLVAEQGEQCEEYTYGKCFIKRSALLRGMKYYDLAVKLFVHSVMHSTGLACADAGGSDQWLDVAGMLAPKREIERLLSDVEYGVVVNTEELIHNLQQIHQDYDSYAAGYARSLIQRSEGNMFYDEDKWRKEADEAYSWWLNMIRSDAEKEYAMGDVDETMLRDFLDNVK